MGCSACAKRRGQGQQRFEARFADGGQQTFPTEREAKAAVARRGGTYRRVS